MTGDGWSVSGEVLGVKQGRGVKGITDDVDEEIVFIDGPRIRCTSPISNSQKGFTGFPFCVNQRPGVTASPDRLFDHMQHTRG